MDQYVPPARQETPAKPTRRRARRVKYWNIKRVPGGWRTLGTVAGILIIALVGWLLFGRSTGSGQARNAQDAPMPVGVAKVVKGDIAVRMNALGTVTPLATVTVKPQVSGQLIAVKFEEGQDVKAGDLLAQIDPRTYQAALDQAKGQLARDQAQLTNARLDLTRYETLLAQDSVSRQQYDTQAALVRQDEGIVKTDEAGVESAAINLDYTRIVSPIAGRVGLRQVDLGNIVQAGSATGIAVVTQMHPISVLFAVPEDAINDIATHLKAAGTLQADAYDRAQVNLLTTGKLTTLDNVIDSSTGTLKLRALFDNTDESLFPNQFVNIKLLIETKKDQTIVPTAAVQRGSQGTYVFVVNSDNTVKMTNIELGAADGEQQAITGDALKAGDTVVVDGADRLRNGAHIDVPDANAPQDGAKDDTKDDSKTNAKKPARARKAN